MEEKKAVKIISKQIQLLLMEKWKRRIWISEIGTHDRAVSFHVFFRQMKNDHLMSFSRRPGQIQLFNKSVERKNNVQGNYDTATKCPKQTALNSRIISVENTLNKLNINPGFCRW